MSEPCDDCGIDVVEERVREHDRRISDIENISHETARSAQSLLVITERHSTQLDVVMRVVYGGLGLSVTAVLGMFLKTR